MSHFSIVAGYPSTVNTGRSYFSFIVDMLDSINLPAAPGVVKPILISGLLSASVLRAFFGSTRIVDPVLTYTKINIYYK